MPEIAPKVPASTGSAVTLAATSLKSSVPNVKYTRKTATRRPQSPSELTMKALVAPEAAGVSNQKPISRYEQSAIPCQPTSSTRKLPARTSVSMNAHDRLKQLKKRAYRRSDSSSISTAA
jgi:hypothetical protein